MRAKFVLLAAVCCGIITQGAAQVITELTIQERAGVARQNEPIRMGVPFAKGVVKEPSEIVLRGANGMPLPAQVSEVMRWPEDNSLRWAHVIFQASVPANGRTTVGVARGKAAGASMSARAADGAVLVDNGVLRLKFSGENLIDMAFYDPSKAFSSNTQIIKPHKEGLVARIDGKTFKASADSKVAIEEQGSESVVVRISGKLSDGATAPFEYVCYAHVYRASPVVRLDIAYTCVHGAKAGDFVTLEDWSLVLPTSLGGGTAVVGGERSPFTGKSAKIVAKSSDLSEIETDGRQAGTSKGKSSKPTRIGWAGLTKGNQGLSVGVRWFWQMFPKAVEVTADGKLRAGLYAAEVGEPLDTYMGQGRTHYVTLRFGGEPAAKLSDFFAGTQVPLRAVASPQYYSRDSEGFGKVAEANPALFAPDVARQMKEFDEGLLQSARGIEKKIDGHTYNGVTMDSYGYYPWGDLFHHANTRGVTDKWNILWESNYYDYPWACGLQFARTGDMLYLDVLERNGLHLADVFMCKYAPNPRYVGACRYSPPANHVGNDVDYQRPQPYFSVEFNHHKAQSILARYYLLGDLRARDDFMLALNNAMTNPEGAWRQARGPGAKLATLYSGYILTRNPEILEKMKQTMAGAIKLKDNVKGFSRQGKSGYFMMCIATEGMYYYWLLTGDKETLETITNVNDFLISEMPWGVSGASGTVALLHSLTGDAKYKDASMKLLKRGQELRPKNFAQHWRSSAYAWYYMMKK